LNPSEESKESFRKKLEFYENNGLDYFTIDVKKKDNKLKPFMSFGKKLRIRFTKE
jgi:hypothetical protein